jgi:hypothetical protein
MLTDYLHQLLQQERQFSSCAVGFKIHTLGMNSGSATSRNMLEESNKKIIKIAHFF